VSLGRYLLGVLLAVAALGPVCASAGVLRARFLPGWSGAPAALASVVIGLGMVTGVCELLGAVGLFREAAVVPGLIAASLLAWYLGRRRVADHPSEAPGRPPPPSRLGRAGPIIALAAVAVVIADWSTRTVAAFHHGMSGADTFWYHMPVAARFVQSHSVTGVHYVDSSALTAFFPSGIELLHGFGIMLLGSDLLSPVLNTGFLAFALLAAWCIGRPFGLAPVTLAGASVALTTPILVATQPGSGLSDIGGIALLLAAIALLVTGSRDGSWTRPGVVAIAALAAGLAAGTKLQFLIPVAALSVGLLLVAPARKRLRIGACWGLVAGVACGLWYVRNLVDVGNPLPLVGARLGPVTVHAVSLKTHSSTVAQYLSNGTIWENIFLPGLGRAFGMAWWGLLALVFLGLILGLWLGENPILRLAAAFGITAIVAYVLTPQALGVPGSPIFFAYNLRYMALALLLGLVLLPLLPVFAGTRVRVVLGAFLVLLLLVQFDPSIWPTELRRSRFGAPASAVDSLVGLGIGACVLAAGLFIIARRRQRRTWRPGRLSILLGSLMLVAAGFALHQYYLDHRYFDGKRASASELRTGDVRYALPVVYTWARDQHHQRIAIVGNFLQYPLYGKDLSNHVQYVGVRRSHGTYDSIDDCKDWRRALNSGRYTYVLTAPNPAFPRRHPREERWTATDPGAERILRDRGASLFRIRDRLDPEGCAGPTKA
jgi:hypothetical protein